MVSFYGVIPQKHMYYILGKNRSAFLTNPVGSIRVSGDAQSSSVASHSDEWSGGDVLLSFTLGDGVWGLVRAVGSYSLVIVNFAKVSKVQNLMYSLRPFLSVVSGTV